MRGWKFVAVMLICLGFAVVLNAGQNQYGVADRYSVVFDNPIRVGDVLLPQGNYQIVHTMEGDNHVMVFTQEGVKSPATTRAKCSLVPLQGKASETQKIYILNANNERVLRELIFKGDTAKHVF